MQEQSTFFKRPKRFAVICGSLVLQNRVSIVQGIHHLRRSPTYNKLSSSDVEPSLLLAMGSVSTSVLKPILPQVSLPIHVPEGATPSSTSSTVTDTEGGLRRQHEQLLRAMILRQVRRLYDQPGRTIHAETPADTRPCCPCLTS